MPILINLDDEGETYGEIRLERRDNDLFAALRKIDLSFTVSGLSPKIAVTDYPSETVYGFFDFGWATQDAADRSIWHSYPSHLIPTHIRALESQLGDSGF
jgi:hypothetical protein